MSTQTPIPSEIAAIIKQKRLAVLEKQKQTEEAEKSALRELEIKGSIMWSEYVGQSLLKVPEYLRPYLDFLLGESDYVRIGKGWDRVENISLYFTAPGLASIEFDPKKGNWRAQGAHWSNDWDLREPPKLNFSNSSFWRSDLEFVLGEAAEAVKDYEEYWKEYSARQEEQARKWEQNEQAEKEREERQRKTEIRNELEHQKEQAEEQALFDAIKNDPVGIHMLRAFAYLLDERNSFQARIEEADEAMSSNEAFWSNKTSELRRQADDAQRRADDERSRLQSDLDDVEAKLKKEQHKQSGW